ncbi:hypothetical protein HY386_00600 [Candidatus Daviesbacteria bacterium]|nr:hypothetical protein [Candidatus Daviesbacteria bacterium]
MTKKFNTKKPHFEYLRKRWTQKHRQLQNELWEKHKDVGRQLAISGIGGLMLLTTPAAAALPTTHLLAGGGQIVRDTDKNVLLAAKLSSIVPNEMRSLNAEEEKEIAKILSNSFGFPIMPELQGKRLNRTYGLIGGEQHLYRYPGDNLYKHADTAVDAAMYGPAGIAPGLGAWGHFAPSEAEFSEKNKLQERYYLAVQTFLAPGFAERVGEYRDFFKFRKMLVVNPKTGQAVVAVVGDAGPSQWTGKHLGGSPEVMHFLGLAQGPRKGAVLYFFVDDPDDKVPLGPVKAQNIQG